MFGHAPSHSPIGYGHWPADHGGRVGPCMPHAIIIIGVVFKHWKSDQRSGSDRCKVQLLRAGIKPTKLRGIDLCSGYPQVVSNRRR